MAITRRVAAILREELPRAESLPKDGQAGYARARFAAQLARTELQTALQMAADFEQEQQNLCLARMAHVIAATNPEAAEELLGRIRRTEPYTDLWAVGVAFRMAPADLPRAIRIVERFADSRPLVNRSLGLGAIAWAIRDTNPQQAADCLSRP